MPVYEYSCSICGKVFEKQVPFTENQAIVRCPSGHQQVQRIYRPVSVIFKGNGFYSTDHAHTSSHDVGKS
jgi:putative FmdB family regulatory protein